MTVKKGDKIKVEYTGKFEDGTVFDSSQKHDAPLEFTVGEGQVIPGFDNAVIGKNVGDEMDITIAPKDGYGEHNPELVKDFPRSQLPPEAKVDDMILLTDPSGREFPSRVAKLTDEHATIDLNYPLAGKTLLFKIKILEVVQ